MSLESSKLDHKLFLEVAVNEETDISYIFMSAPEIANERALVGVVTVFKSKPGMLRITHVREHNQLRDFNLADPKVFDRIRGTIESNFIWAKQDVAKRRALKAAKYHKREEDKRKQAEARAMAKRNRWKRKQAGRIRLR
jgi:hypothetical protein